ncbi:iron ABC transporter permease [Cryobacterium melibiosiphilum]|uniref:Iron ABC transporter permease n=1 Tax=Cryobacterium melibiosiphilum TaxID=995039 RepID=A0A3A5M8V3_9MICO|nr:iron ABC transporter permease [Cryobacterium melibiosiphilum]RJT85681.1 iron ABC transporter permease [Cryobacterium melibiosiphilum]
MSITLDRPPVDNAPPPAPRPTVTPRRRMRIGRFVVSGPLLLLVGFLVLVPVGFVVLAAFSTSVPRPGNIDFALTLENFRTLADPSVMKATGNSLLIASLATLLALVIGGFLAFITARSNVPFRAFIYAIGLMPLFLPSYVGALAWAILGSPSAGLLNVALRDLGLAAVVDVYSFGGVVMVMAIFYAPYAFLMIHSAMSMMNPDLEDAAGVHGGSMAQTLKNVTFPLALPAILGSGLLIFILVLENFPVAQVLATPAGIDTLPTYIYRVMMATPARGNDAATVAIVLVAFVLLLTSLQRRYLAKRSYTTVTGKGMKARRVDLGRAQWPAVVFAGGYFLLSVVLPLLALLLTAGRVSPYMSSFRDLAAPGALDFSVFGEILSSASFFGVAGNSIFVSVLAAALGTALAFAVAYVINRTRARGRALLEGISMVPLAVPHIVLGIGLLWTWLIMPIPLYGTIWVLVVAFLVVQMPQGLRSVSASIQATHRDLEDSAVMLGARRAKAIAFVTLPLMKVTLASSFLLLLMLSMRELTVPLFLYTTDTKILSIEIFDLFENGGAAQEAAAMSVIYCVIMFIVSYLPQRFGNQKH